MIETLDDNDVMVSVNCHLVPITIDSGAKMSIFQQEFIQQSDFVGETFKFKGVLAGYKWREAQVTQCSYQDWQ